MGFNFNFSFGRNRMPNYIERDGSGGFFYSIIDSFKRKKRKDFDKYYAVVNSPAVVFVFNLIGEYYSIGKYHTYKNNKIDIQDYFYTKKQKPNQWQSWVDFDKNFVFSLLTGTAYLYIQNDTMYFLNYCKMKLSEAQKKKFEKLNFSKYGSETRQNIMKGEFEYNGQTLDLKNLHIIHDTCGINLTGTWLKGLSRLDALYEVVMNSDLSLTAEGSNLEFTQQFSISGQHDRKDVTSIGMSAEEKKSLENSYGSGKKFHVSKEKVDVKQLVDNLANLKLDESFFNKVHIIGRMFGVPKDVIEFSLKGGATFENQEKSMGRFVEYTLKPLAYKFTDVIESVYNLEDLRKDFGHLMFNKVFEQENENVRKTKIENLEKSLQLGLDANFVNQKIKEIWELS